MQDLSVLNYNVVGMGTYIEARSNAIKVQPPCSGDIGSIICKSFVNTLISKTVPFHSHVMVIKPDNIYAKM